MTSEQFDHERKTHPIPEAVREAVLKRAGRRCESCGRSDSVELHHLTYYQDVPWAMNAKHAVPLIFGHETPDDLTVLCRDCHLGKHIDPLGDFHADPEDCEAEWDYFNHLMNKDD